VNQIPGGQAGALTVITCLLIAYVVSILYHAIKRPNLGALFHIGSLLAVLYVGWTIRTWPTRAKGDGLVWSLLIAWRDSIITLVFLFADAVGLSGVVEWLMRLWDEAGRAT
jgi:hypothetical protein